MVLSEQQLIFFIVVGIFVVLTICALLGFWLLWSRRKLIKTQFLDETGQWEIKWRKPKDIGSTFEHDGKIYNFKIEKCTRDKINRPVAMYYRGNPEQQNFDVKKYANKKIQIETDIGTEEITTKDFITLIKSKVISEMFDDDTIVGLIIIAIIVSVIGFLIVILLHFFGGSSVCTLKADNETIQVIADGVRMAIAK